MLPRADLAGTRPTASVEAPTPVNSSTDARQEIFHRLSQIAIGSQLQAEVLSRLNDGTFLVRIADTTARMNLPTGTRIGESLPMTMLTAEPRPTFLLGSEPGSATATLSSAGRLIDSLLQNAQQQGMAPAITGKTPLASSPALLLSAGATPQIASALHDTVAFSGAFYESHVQQWSNGGRTLVDLIKEPQAQSNKILLPAALTRLDLSHHELMQLVQASKMLSTEFMQLVPANKMLSPEILARPDTPRHELVQLLQATKAVSPEVLARLNMPPNELAQIVTQIRNAVSLEQPMVDLSHDPQMQSNPVAPTDADILASAFKPATMSIESMQLINVQLNTLEQKQVVWQGELFPGQPLEWEIRDDTPRRQAKEDAQPSWQSTVRFTLPLLGTISATIHLVGERLHVQVNTATEAAAVSLREHSAELADALGAAGSPLDSLLVKQDEKA